MRERAPKLEAAQKAHEAALEGRRGTPPPEEFQLAARGGGRRVPPACARRARSRRRSGRMIKSPPNWTEWRVKNIAAKNDVQAPCRATRAYVLQSWTSAGRARITSTRCPSWRRVDLPARASRWRELRGRAHAGFLRETRGCRRRLDSPGGPDPEPDDAPGKLTAKFIEARAAAIAARDWDHGCRKIACLHAQFPRDAESLDPVSMAAFAAEYCGHLAVADIEYQRWSPTTPRCPTSRGSPRRRLTRRTSACTVNPAGVPHERPRRGGPRRHDRAGVAPPRRWMRSARTTCEKRGMTRRRLKRRAAIAEAPAG